MRFKDGAKVKWIAKMVPVPHPEGKTDRDGNVLPVLRDCEMFGSIKMVAGKTTYWVWRDGRNYYSRVDAADLSDWDG